MGHGAITNYKALTVRILLLGHECGNSRYRAEALRRLNHEVDLVDLRERIASAGRLRCISNRLLNERVVAQILAAVMVQSAQTIRQNSVITAGT